MTCCSDLAPRPTTDRRTFLTAAFGGAALLALPATMVRAQSVADALVISCMDYRLADDVHRFLDTKGLTDRYDHVVLAGASAGVMHDGFAAWHDTFWTHLDVAIQLHGITKVIVIDHRDCGAYKIAYGPEHAADPAEELALHAKVIGEMAAAIRARKPGLEVEGYLMALDGSAEAIPL